MNNMESNKEQAVSFLKLVSSGLVEEAYSKYVSPEFRHHNPYFPGNIEALKEGMEDSAVKRPDKILQVHQAIEENNLVMVHSHIKQSPEDIGSAVVHIFRFEKEQIVELWDVGQAVPEDSQNENGMF